MLCENCHFNEAEVKLTVKGIDSTHEKWVCSVCAQGENPWLHSNDDNTYHTHQDDIEEAFVVKQILQHMVLIFMRWHLKKKKNAQRVR